MTGCDLGPQDLSVTTQRGSRSPAEPACLPVPSRGVSPCTPRAAQAARAQPAALTSSARRSTPQAAPLLPAQLPSLGSSPPLRGAGSEATVQSCIKRCRKTYPQLVSHEQSWEGARSPASPRQLPQPELLNAEVAEMQGPHCRQGVLLARRGLAGEGAAAHTCCTRG